jgi:hypothetical protein
VQTSPNPATASWAAYGGLIVTVGNTNNANFAPATGDMFFRLSFPLQ